MKKSLGGAAKARERKKIKLEQVAHNYSQNISSTYAITKKSSTLEPVEPQGNKFTQPNSQLQTDEDHKKYLVDDSNIDEAEEELISAQVDSHSNISNSIHIPILHKKEKQEIVVDNIVQLPSSILQGSENPKDRSLTKSDKIVQPEMIFPAINGQRFSWKFYEKFNWIEFSVSNDALFCFPCRHFAANLSVSGQGLAIRVHIESVSQKNKGNFIELLEMFTSDEMKLRLQSWYGHYTSASYKNDFIQIIATLTRQHILGFIQKRQMSFLLRFMDNDFNIWEKSIGCYHMKNSNAESLANKIFKILSTNKLDKMNCIGQCYDGASVMSGDFLWVQERIRSEVPHGQKDKNLDVMHIERLIDTRWAYWFISIKKIVMRFSELLEVLSVLSNEGDQTARAIGILNEMSTLPFILTSLSMEALLQTVHCASLGLQNSNVIQSVAVNLINSIKESIEQMHIDTFWENINNSAKIIAEKNGITIENSRKNRKLLNKNLNNFFVQSTIGHNSK
ncbi:zinc finger MYM-type protein 1-like [Aphis craccivora]|uniref:Zinc finger MYM-type protein 1-like n=1 Tax=Aphis craccivora TaxID=307492 RepID=A0A6G0Z6V0_APHCR|nr:zinc finger MYM-type protein 1-like [Aphis craccivora]